MNDLSNGKNGASNTGAARVVGRTKGCEEGVDVAGNGVGASLGDGGALDAECVGESTVKFAKSAMDGGIRVITTPSFNVGALR